jgi:hypothetical protein
VVLGRDLRPLPSEDLLLLHAFAGAGSDIPGEFGPWRHGGGVAEQREEEEDGRR